LGENGGSDWCKQQQGQNVLGQDSGSTTEKKSTEAKEDEGRFVVAVE